MAERAGLAEQAPGVAGRADRGDLVGPGALHHECAGAKLISGGPRHRLGLAGQDRLVETEINRPAELSVGNHLVPGLDFDNVPLDHPGRRDAARRAVAEHVGMWGDEQRESLQRPLGADLLRNSDPCVRDQDPEEQGVSPIAEHERHRAKAGQDQVEDREDVGADDAGV